jgi:hypothetical protein
MLKHLTERIKNSRKTEIVEKLVETTETTTNAVQ